MKKMTFLACAAMLTSAIAFTGCKSNDPIGYEGDAEVVKTEFAISLPSSVAGNGAKHMPATTVQTTPAQFQGMTSIILIPFATADSIKGADARLGKNIALTDGIAKSGTVDTRLGNNSNAKVFTDVAIPLTTASFLFYGKSAATSDAANAKFIVGSLIVDTASTHDNPSGFSFKLDSIITQTQYDNAMAADGHGGKLMAYLTSIAAATDAEAGTIHSWYEYTSSMTGDSAAYYQMFQAYQSLEDLSSFQVERMLTDLYKSLKPRRESSVLADHIMDAIESTTYTTGAPFANDSVKLIDALKTFPQELNIPEGAVRTQWVGSTTNAFQKGDYSGKAAPTKFVYPVNLWYYANSAIKTSNTSKKSLYDDTNTWGYITGQHADGTAVSTQTRSVVLVDSVQYGVARLDVQVKLASGTELADNSESAEGTATPVDVATHGGLPVTAILVGGQNHVGYDFKPTAAGGYTIYDNVMASAMIATASYSATKHTLVLESMADTPVRIAVEMENNNGADFYGYADQLVPKGSKFYVVAELNLTAGADKTLNTPHNVFKQDYTTTAKLNLKDLKKAYNTIPDLRTPELEIGFAVSLTWQNGNEYTIDFE